VATSWVLTVCPALGASWLDEDAGPQEFERGSAIHGSLERFHPSVESDLSRAKPFFRFSLPPEALAAGAGAGLPRAATPAALFLLPDLIALRGSATAHPTGLEAVAITQAADIRRRIVCPRVHDDPSPVSLDRDIHRGDEPLETSERVGDAAAGIEMARAIGMAPARTRHEADYGPVSESNYCSSNDDHLVGLRHLRQRQPDRV
jgi:hypothetical protein